jgi:hypothetical protein
MNRKSVCRILLVLACVVPPVHSLAQQTASDPWYGRQAKSKDFDAPKEFTGAFSIELPKGWQLGSGHMETLFLLTQRTKNWEAGAVITLEQIRLQLPLDPAIMATVSDREMREAQARDSTGKQFSNVVKNGDHGPVILVQYDRTGMTGVTDHVAQYSMPVGTTMYRLICIAPAAQIEKYRPIFAHVAASFTSLKAAS